MGHTVRSRLVCLLILASVGLVVANNTTKPTRSGGYSSNISYYYQGLAGTLYPLLLSPLLRNLALFLAILAIVIWYTTMPRESPRRKLVLREITSRDDMPFDIMLQAGGTITQNFIDNVWIEKGNDPSWKGWVATHASRGILGYVVVQAFMQYSDQFVWDPKSWMGQFNPARRRTAGVFHDVAEYAREEGFSSLVVASTVNSIGFYEKFGFTHVKAYARRDLSQEYCARVLDKDRTIWDLPSHMMYVSLEPINAKVELIAVVPSKSAKAASAAATPVKGKKKSSTTGASSSIPTTPQGSARANGRATPSRTTPRRRERSSSRVTPAKRRRSSRG